MAKRQSAWVAWLMLARALAAAGFVVFAFSRSSYGQDLPDWRLLNERAFVPSFDAVCGLGNDRFRGCDGISARDLLDASARPWSAIGRLNFASIDQRSHCTGTLVGERTVLTAAHCLYNLSRKSWIPATSLTFLAGYQRGVAVAQATGVRYVLDDTQDPLSRDFRGEFSQDWALVELDNPIGRGAGVLPLATLDDLSSLEVSPFLAGYAGLRPHILTAARDCGKFGANDAETLLILSCSTMRGDSGAPVLLERDGQFFVIGVHNFIASHQEHGVFSVAVLTDVFASRLRSAQMKD